MTPLSGGGDLREELPDIVIEDFSDCIVVTQADTMRTQNIRVERGTKVIYKQTIDIFTSLYLHQGFGLSLIYRGLDRYTEDEVRDAR